jgi:K+-transporting ATPase ATPase C chain
MKQYLRPALSIFVGLSIITGLAYPLIVTGIGKVAFPSQAEGSLIRQDDRIVGSKLIGQQFSSPAYFWGRPSATAPYPYNAAASSGSNQGPLNPALEAAVKERIAALKSADPDNTQAVPVDLVTASASGLDPHISPAAALYQADRVARARQLDRAQILQLIAQHTKGKQFGIFGENRVNVLSLNLSLDALKQVR